MNSNIIKSQIKLACLFIIIFLFPQFVYSQCTTPNAKSNSYLCLPKLYNTNLSQDYYDKIASDIIKIDTSNKVQSNWVVYSDRNNNNTYKYPNSTSHPLGKLDFMEPLYVKQVEGNWLNVYSGVYNDNGTIKNNVSRGWIHAKYLVLSRWCVLGAKLLPSKALILMSLSTDIKGDLSEGIIKREFYNRPEAHSSNFNGKYAGKFKIYFILKKVDGSCLLSSADQLDGGHEAIKGTVDGWMPNANITIWDHRVCLEPSSTTNAVTDYEKKPLPIFLNKEKLKSFTENQIYIKSEVFARFTVGTKRPSAYEMRLPILDTDVSNNKIKQVVTMGRLDSLDVNNNNKNEAELKKKIQETKDKLESVNILFVIDATQSMRDYFQPVANAIKQIIENNELQKNKNRLRFGVVIYRDYPDGEGAYNIIPLSDNYTDIINKVKETRCFSKDSDAPEALYNGLLKGIKEAGFDPKQSNMVVMIGDAGNHQPDPKGIKLEDITAQLKKYNCNLVAFQVYNGNHMAYVNFGNDAQDLLRKTAEQFVNNKSDVKLLPVSSKNTYKLQISSSKNDYTMYGRFTYASSASAMSTDILKQNIIETMNEYIIVVEKLKVELESALFGDNEGPDGVVFTKEFIIWLKAKMGYTNAEIEILKKSGNLIMKGYTATQMYAISTSECFSPVVFLSESEKYTLTSRLKALTSQKTSQTNKQNELAQALTTQCMKILGEQSDESVKNKSLNEVWNIILGIDFPGKWSIGNTKLKDINSISPVLFNPFYTSFERDCKKFIERNFDDSIFEMYNTKYYWIPLNEIPGSGNGL